MASNVLPEGKKIIMSMQHHLPDQIMQHHLPDQIVRADPWKLFCAECSQKMRIMTATPAQVGRETRTYGCICGHREVIDVALHRLRTDPAAVFMRNRPVTVVAAPLSDQKETAKLSTIRTTRNRPNLLEPSLRDAMLAAVPNLRAFAISLSRDVDRADDLVQETLVRAMANIDSFQSGTNLPGWLFTILRNVFRSEYRNRRREVEDTDGSYVDSLKSPPEQQGRLELEEFRAALAKLPFGQREALLLVGAAGFSYQETAAICETAEGTIKSRVNRARIRLSELLAIDSAEDFGQDRATRAVLTADGHG